MRARFVCALVGLLCASAACSAPPESVAPTPSTGPPLVLSTPPAEAISFALPLSVSCADGSYWGKDGACSANPAALAPWIVPADGSLDRLFVYLASVPAVAPTLSVVRAASGMPYTRLPLAVLASASAVVFAQVPTEPVRVVGGDLVLLQTDRAFSGAASASLDFLRSSGE